MRDSLARVVKVPIDYSENKGKKAKENNNIETKKENLSKMATPSIGLDTIINAFPTFDGKRNTNIQNFIEQYETLANEIKIPEKLKLIILRGKFTGQARDAILEYEDIDEEVNFDEFKTKAIKLFKKEFSFEKSQAEFMQLKQLPTQTIGDFVKKFNSAAAKYLNKSGLSDKEGAKEFLSTIKMPKFLEQIRPDIATPVRMQGPKDFEQAVKIATQVEQALKTNDSESINAINRDNKGQKELYEAILALSKKQEDNIANLKEEINALKVSDNASKLVKKPIKFCGICQWKGHTTSECRYNIKDKNKNDTKEKTETANQSAPLSQNSAIGMQPQASNFPQPIQNHMSGQLMQNYATPSTFNPFQGNFNVPGINHNINPNYQTAANYNGNTNWPNIHPEHNYNQYANFSNMQPFQGYNASYNNIG